MVSAMSVLSGTLGFGGGTGLVVVGLLVNHGANYHRVFWLTTGFTVVVIAIVILVVPARPRSATGSIDWLGAVGLAAGLSAILLAITQGNTWGWTSLRTLACAAGGVLITVGWWLWERRAEQPLVSTAMLTRRPIMLTNLATIFVGMGLYFAFLGLTQFVQIPREAAGYGFGATVLEASVIYLLPGAVTGFLVALISGRFIDRFGARPVLVVAAAAGITGFLFIALAHSAPWQVIAASILANAYISLGYGALPALVVSEVYRRRNRCGHRHERDRPHDRKLHRGGARRGAARPHDHRHIRPDGEQLRRDLHRRRVDRRAGDGAHRIVPGAGTRYRNRRGALRIPRHEPRVGLAQRGEVRHRLADLRLQHPGHAAVRPAC